MEKDSVVYHAHLEGHTLEEGYIGITSDFKARLAQHKHATFTKKLPYKVYCAFRKHWDNLKWVVVFTGSYEQCRAYEKELRPKPLMGWNSVEGGQEAHRTQLGKKRPEHSEWCKVNGFAKGNSAGNKPVYCGGFIFPSIKIAIDVMQVDRKTIFNRIKNSKFENYSYLGEGVTSLI